MLMFSRDRVQFAFLTPHWRVCLPAEPHLALYLELSLSTPNTTTTATTRSTIPDYANRSRIGVNRNFLHRADVVNTFPTAYPQPCKAATSDSFS